MTEKRVLLRHHLSGRESGSGGVDCVEAVQHRFA
jgi:hypothetical protein